MNRLANTLLGEQPRRLALSHAKSKRIPTDTELHAEIVICSLLSLNGGSGAFSHGA